MVKTEITLPSVDDALSVDLAQSVFLDYGYYHIFL